MGPTISPSVTTLSRGILMVLEGFGLKVAHLVLWLIRLSLLTAGLGVSAIDLLRFVDKRPRLSTDSVAARFPESNPDRPWGSCDFSSRTSGAGFRSRNASRC